MRELCFAHRSFAGRLVSLSAVRSTYGALNRTCKIIPEHELRPAWHNGRGVRVVLPCSACCDSYFGGTLGIWRRVSRKDREGQDGGLRALAPSAALGLRHKRPEDPERACGAHAGSGGGFRFLDQARAQASMWTGPFAASDLPAA